MSGTNDFVRVNPLVEMHIIDDVLLDKLFRHCQIFRFVQLRFQLERMTVEQATKCCSQTCHNKNAKPICVISLWKRHVEKVTIWLCVKFRFEMKKFFSLVVSFVESLALVVNKKKNLLFSYYKFFIVSRVSLIMGYQRQSRLEKNLDEHLSLLLSL